MTEKKDHPSGKALESLQRELSRMPEYVDTFLLRRRGLTGHPDRPVPPPTTPGVGALQAPSGRCAGYTRATRRRDLHE